jgi:hypothetical protein
MPVLTHDSVAVTGPQRSTAAILRALTFALVLVPCAAVSAAAQGAASQAEAPLSHVNALVQQRTKAKPAVSATGARSKTKSNAVSSGKAAPSPAAAVAPEKGWAPPPATVRPAAKRR